MILQVHEHGHRGLDREAEAELARKREQIAREHRSTHDEETRQTSLRPDVNVHHRTNVVEEVSLMALQVALAYYLRFSTPVASAL